MSRAATRICIVGGGITGLAAAWALKQKQQEGASLTVDLLEAGDRVGGKVQTTRKDGFTLEHGPDSFITQKPQALALCRELGLEDQLIPCNTAQQKVYIAHRNTLHPLPAGFRLLAPTNFSSFLSSTLFSVQGKLRALCEPMIPKKESGEDESISDFVTRRLGREILDRAAGPMLGGIYNGHPDNLSILSTFPMLRMLEQKHGSLVRGFRAMKPQNGSTPMFMSLQDGMGTLTDALAGKLDDIIQTNISVLAIQQQENEWTVETSSGSRNFDIVILATPAAISAQLLQQAAPQTVSKLETLTTTSLVAVSMGFKDEQLEKLSALDGFGFVTSLSPNRRLTACTWSSTKFNGRAPEGHHLVRVFINCPAPDCSRDDTQWLTEARHELKPFMTWTGEPLTSMVTRWPNSSPQYPVNHRKHLQDIQDSLTDSPGLILAGSSLDGVGLPDCIRQGCAAAETAKDN